MRGYFYEVILKKRIPPFGYGVDDGAALHFIDGRLSKVVSSSKNAKAHLLVHRLLRISVYEDFTDLLIGSH